MEIKDLAIVEKKKLGLLQGKIHLLKVNFNWDFIREKVDGEISMNTNQDFMNWILEIDESIKELYATTKKED